MPRSFDKTVNCEALGIKPETLACQIEALTTRPSQRFLFTAYYNNQCKNNSNEKLKIIYSFAQLCYYWQHAIINLSKHTQTYVAVSSSKKRCLTLRFGESII